MPVGEFRLGKYQLLVEVARGGMGVVCLGVAHGPGGFSKLLIIKELKAELVDEPAYLTMFLEEARLAARLDHQNIVQTLEVGQEGDRHYIAMEYLQGQPLSRIRRRRGVGFSLNAELRVISESLRGLHYAHTLKDYDGSPVHVIHRDVSPQNVFVTYDGQVKIVDFGIAKAADTAQETQAGMFKGKAGYVSPEQVAGGTLDPRTDVFAAGVMMWEAAAGRRLWSKQNDVETLQRLLKKDIPTIKSVKPDVDDELARIVDRAMAWTVEDRYPSAEALATDIDSYLAVRGPASNLREIGEFVQTAFRAEREQLRGVVEKQLAALKQPSHVTAVRTLPMLGASEWPKTGDSGQLNGPVSGMVSTDLASEQSISFDDGVKRLGAIRPRLALALVMASIAAAAFVWIVQARTGSAPQTAARALDSAAIEPAPEAKAAPSRDSTPQPQTTQGDDRSAVSDVRGDLRLRRTFHASAPVTRAEASLPADAAPERTPVASTPTPVASSPPPPPASAIAVEKPRVRLVEDPERVKIVE